MLASVALVVASCNTPSDARRVGAADPVSGLWDATLEIPAGEVAFGLDLARSGDEIGGAILNGPDRLELSGGSFDGERLTLGLDYYDGTIAARFADPERRVLEGEYARMTSAGRAAFPFRATRHAAASAGATTAPVSAGALEAMDISGDWIMTVKSSDGTDERVDEATFQKGELENGRLPVTGTVIPVSGDYGLLSGWVEMAERPRFRLSRFDGIHVTLLTGEVRPDGSLAGELASGPSYRVAFTAMRDDAGSPASGQPADPNAVTTVKNPTEPFAFTLPDLEGRPVSLSDERFQGKAVVVDIFGTWCPNCHDEAPLLVDLYKRYKAEGLAIVALAYEYTDDVERNRRQIEIYRRKYGIDFPILMAGTTAEGEIARTLPQLQGFGAYPTTIFIGRDGRVRKIHAGFSGPATGPRHDEVKRDFEETVRQLVAGGQ